MTREKHPQTYLIKKTFQGELILQEKKIWTENFASEKIHGKINS